MGNIRHPRRGSLQYWPRKRSRHTIARIRYWVPQTKVKILGFIGYKAGMTHIQVLDNRPKSITKGETITYPVTIIDCPPLRIAGAAFYGYSDTGELGKLGVAWAEKLDPELSRRQPLSKKKGKSVSDFPHAVDIRVLIYTIPADATKGIKRPKLVEMALGGTKDEKLKYVSENLGKEISITDVFEAGNQVDVHGITKGVGHQGTVKRFGVPIRQHKAEKTKRGIATLGSWKPKRVEFSVAQAGKMGFHARTEYNKQIIKIVNDGKDVTPAGGIINYGIVRHPSLLVKGSLPGPKKRALFLTTPLRPNHHMFKDAPEVKYISK